MPILLRNTPVTVRLVATPAHDKFGQARLEAPVRTMVAVVRLSAATTSTPLRAEQSASHGRAGMEIADAVLLFDWRDAIKNEAVVEVYGTTFKVRDIFPRADMSGRLDRGHLEVHLMRGAA